MFLQTAGVVSLLSVMMAMPAGAAPGPLFDVPRLPDITLDGRADDWGSRGFHIEALVSSTSQRPAPADSSARIRLGWNEQGLLLLMTVRDDAFSEDAGEDFWNKDSIELFAANGLGQNERYQVALSPGLDAAHATPRLRLVDSRGEELKKSALNVPFARTITPGGYTLEVLLPWQNLGITPQMGRAVALQINLNDVDQGGAKTQLRWYPEEGAFSDSKRMMALRLAERPSPAVLAAVSGRYERFRRVRINVEATRELAGQSVVVRDGKRSLHSGKLQSSTGGANARIALPLPPRGKAYGPLVVSVGGRYAGTVTLPDLESARRGAFDTARLMAYPSVFSGTAFPDVYFEQPSFVEDIIGPYELESTFYDVDFHRVESAEKPGRYGAIVEVKAEDGRRWKRFVTLFRQPQEIKWYPQKLRFNAELPEGLGIDPAVVREQARQVDDFFKWRLYDGFNQEPDTAGFLAGLYETKPGEAAVDRTSAARREQDWWYLLKKKTGDAKPLQYLLSLPPGYDQDAAKRWPLMLFLHGSGERGDNVQMVKTHGPPMLAAKGQAFPFIVVSPQCPPFERWNPLQLNDLLDEIAAKYRVDADRIYLTGLSMGGSGTWNFAMTYPQRFAAIAPMATGGDAEDAARVKNLPIWYFIGSKDGDVPERAHKMVDALRKAGADLRFTEYPDAGHVETWTKAYDDPQFYQWLLQQRRR